LSSANLRRFAAALQPEPPSSSQPSSAELTDNVGQTSHEERGDGFVETDSSQEDVAMETADDDAIEMTTLRRHDSLKAKKRAVLAALAERRLQTAQNNRCVIHFTVIVC